MKSPANTTDSELIITRTALLLLIRDHCKMLNDISRAIGKHEVEYMTEAIACTYIDKAREEHGNT